MEDKKYESPRIKDHGDLAQITAASLTGAVFDADYPAGTPIPPGGIAGSTP